MIADDEESVKEILHSLGMRLLNSIWDKDLGFIKSNTSVYIGRFVKDTFDWYSESYSSALIIEALSIFID